jgi:hypothetical protein
MANHILKNENKILQGLIGKLDELRRFNTLLTEHLNDTDIAKHCQVVKFDEKKCLIVIVDNGSWATQLRFHIPDLMTKLRKQQGLENLSGIICKTRPKASFNNPKSKNRSMKKISLETARTILDSAKTIKDKKLREIIEKIAKHSE